MMRDFNKKIPGGFSGKIDGASRGSRTLVSSLGRKHNSRYTILAYMNILA